MKSNVKRLAIAKGIKTPADLQYEARISWPTAKQVWAGDLTKTQLGTARKLATALGCPIDELFVFTKEEEPA